MKQAWQADFEPPEDEETDDAALEQAETEAEIEADWEREGQGG